MMLGVGSHAGDGGHMMVGGGHMAGHLIFLTILMHVTLSGHSSTKFGELRNIVKHILP